jgi:hypothetical protein
MVLQRERLLHAVGNILGKSDVRCCTTYFSIVLDQNTVLQNGIRAELPRRFH